MLEGDKWNGKKVEWIKVIRNARCTLLFRIKCLWLAYLKGGICTQLKIDPTMWWITCPKILRGEWETEVYEEEQNVQYD